MAVTAEKTVYEPWGNCIRVSNGKVELYATLDFGPHIICYRAVGGKNIFHEDLEDKVTKDLSEYGCFEGDTWRIYGGHRLWTSPEALPRSYYPENFPVQYHLHPDGVRLEQRRQEFVNIQLTMDLTMEEDGSVTIEHIVTNHSANPIKMAPWALSVLAQGGLEIVPMPEKDTGLLHNATLAVWPYTDMGDPRVTWGKRYFALRQDPAAETSFKIGLTNEDGFAAYFVHGDLFLKRFPFVEDCVYPDGGMNFETYTSDQFLEMESLGELTEVAVGASVSHKELWKLYPGVSAPETLDTETVDAILRNYL